jgi:hypothetical protein
VRNGTDEAVRIVVFSTKQSPAVAVYPDSDKLGVWIAGSDDSLLVRRDSATDYWAGE